MNVVINKPFKFMSMRKKHMYAVKGLCKGGLILCALLTTMPLQAEALVNQTSKLSLTKSEVSIQSVMKDIEKATGFSFLYNGALINTNAEVSVNLKDASLEQVLTTVFKNSDITYSIVDNQIILSAAAKVNESQNTAQDRTVTGIVKDNLGEGMPGVNVMVKGSTIGTITDIDGKFNLSVPDNAVLVFSYIGFLNQEVKVGNAKQLNILLKEDNKTLDEVIVVGYTTQKKADLTGAVSSVKIEDVRDIAVTGINHALQGKMSGVTVYQNSGAPGASASVRVRGLGTIGNNDPLYVIDGMPADNMNDINPSDIERIDVLKDAASAAIYGSRAANGVVIIQTKKGTRSEKINVTFNTHHGFYTPVKKLDLLDAAGRNMIHTEAYQNDNTAVPSYYTSEIGKATRTDWQDEIFKNGYTGNYDLSLSGGTEKARYNVMMGYLDQQGVLKGSDYNRVNFRVNTEMDITKNFKIGENLMITHSTQGIVDTNGANGAVSSALQFDPSVSVWQNQAEGIYSGNGELGADLRNPVSILDRMDKKRNRDRIFGNVYAQWEIVKGLVAKTDFGYDWSKWREKEYSGIVPEAGRPSTVAELTQQDWQSTRWINTTTLKYENTIGRHKFMALGGWSYESYDMDFINARGSGFASDEESQRYMESASTINWLLTGRKEWALMSGFARLDYSFSDRYLLSANFRADGSSKFAKKNRWGYFPSISGAWRISEEKFFESAKNVMPNLKFRASWGQLGNQNIFDNYPTFSKIVNTNDDDGYNVVFGKDEKPTAGRYESSIANKDIKWEVTEQLDFGIDLSLFGHLDITADYFIKKTSDVLLQVPVTSLAGADNEPWVNSGKVQNKGFELNVAYNGKKNDFTYNVYANISSIKNEVLALGAGSEAIYGSSYRSSNITRTKVGEPMAHFYGYKTDGIFKSEEEVKQYNTLYGKKAVLGDVKFVDVDGNDIIDGNDRTNIGDGFPDFTYGFGFDGDYKGFDLSLFFQGVSGYDIFKAIDYEGMFVRKAYNQFGNIQDRYHPTNNPSGSRPRVTLKDPNGNAEMSDRYVENGNYLKLKNITLGYTFNKKITSKLGMQKLRMYASAQNVFTITKYSGFDPELGETNADKNDAYGLTELAVDRGQFPQARSFIFGININF